MTTLNQSAAPLTAAFGSLGEEELSGFGRRALLENFRLYRRHSSPATQLDWVRVCQGDRLVAIVPVVRLGKRPATDMLQSRVRRVFGPIVGPFAKKTTLLVDTAFLAYDDRSPFIAGDGVDGTIVKRAVSELLKAERGVDSVWISEPAEEAAWAASEGYHQFLVLPMAQIPTAQFETVAEWVAALSKKRRRNRRQEQAAFAAVDGEMTFHEGPLGPPLVDDLLKCLDRSAAHSQFTVPYNDVLTDPHAFAEQAQVAWVARVHDRVVGFMSFLIEGRRMMQCHGGLDYELSLQVFAYHNLIYRAVEHAIEQGYELVSMGPLNNETKRRAATELKPIVASLWSRNPLDRLATRTFFAKNFEVYRGEV